MNVQSSLAGSPASLSLEAVPQTPLLGFVQSCSPRSGVRAIRAAAIIGLSFFMGSAFGAAGDIVASIEPVGVTNVTYSSSTSCTTIGALCTNIAFLISVGNVGGNTINNISYTVKASATDTAESVALDLAKAPLPAGCSPTTNVGEFTCSLGQLKAGKAIASYVVFWKAPVKAVNQISDEPGTDKVSATISGVYAEQSDGATGNPNSTFASTNLTEVVLGTANTLEVKSAVSKLTGASLFTGVGAIATETDPWTTTVIVPMGYIPAVAGATYTSAIIAESENASTLSSDLLTSNSTDLTIPGSSPPGSSLKIILRRDSRTIANGAKISNAQVYYTGTHDPAPIAYPYNVLSCSDTSLGPLPKPGIPCIDRTKSKVYTKKEAQALGNPEWEADWELWLNASDNGLYRN
jgi:hypothetical protein